MNTVNWRYKPVSFLDRMPNVLENAIYNKTIKINGDGSEKLDFTYIKDLVNGVISIIENKNSYNEIFNLTFGSARPILDLVEILN